jgi:hypothetical protein
MIFSGCIPDWRQIFESATIPKSVLFEMSIIIKGNKSALDGSAFQPSLNLKSSDCLLSRDIYSDSSALTSSVALTGS